MPLSLDITAPYIITCLITDFLYRYLCISYANYPLSHRHHYHYIYVGWTFLDCSFTLFFPDSLHTVSRISRTHCTRGFSIVEWITYFFSAISLVCFLPPNFHQNISFLFLLVFRYHSLLVGLIFWVTINLGKETVKKRKKIFIYCL